MPDHSNYSAQCAAIYSALRGGPRTTLEIHHSCGVLAVGARIHELRGMGVEIDTQLVPVRNRHGQRCRVARYSLRKPARRRPAAKAKTATKRRA